MSDVKIAYELMSVERGTGIRHKHYLLSVPMIGHDGVGHHYVVCSAARPSGRPETYVFPADKDGGVTDYSEMPASQNGVYDHELVMADAGYDIYPLGNVLSLLAKLCHRDDELLGLWQAWYSGDTMAALAMADLIEERWHSVPDWALYVIRERPEMIPVPCISSDAIA